MTIKLLGFEKRIGLREGLVENGLEVEALDRG